ncbi:MAG: biotin transporter BioY [Beijerinckiaceae bacterium]
MHHTASAPPLARFTDTTLAKAAAVILGSLTIAVSSWVSVPMYPVPMTMQTWAVLLVGAALGPRLGVAAVLLYLAEGLMGLPVFAGGAASPARFMGPTGGYLMAFPVAAFSAGWLMQQRFARHALVAFAIMMLAHAIIFAGGVPWLAQFIGLEKAVAAGLVPFILGSIVKSALVVATLAAMRTGLARVPTGL